MSVRTELNGIRDQAALWTTLIESGEMSDAQRKEFHLWLLEPAHVRALREYRTLVSIIQELPKQKAAVLTALPMPQARFPSLAALLTSPMRLTSAAAALVALAA